MYCPNAFNNLNCKAKISGLSEQPFWLISAQLCKILANKGHDNLIETIISSTADKVANMRVTWWKTELNTKDTKHPMLNWLIYKYGFNVSLKISSRGRGGSRSPTFQKDGPCDFSNMQTIWGISYVLILQNMCLTICQNLLQSVLKVHSHTVLYKFFLIWCKFSELPVQKGKFLEGMIKLLYI